MVDLAPLKKGGVRGGGIVDIGKKALEITQQEKEAEIACVAKGGRWDAANKVCILPPPKVEGGATPPTAPTPTAPEVLRDKDSGKISGVEIDGQIFRGNREDIERLIGFETRKTATPEGAEEFGTAQAAAEGRALVGQVGQTEPSPLGGSEGVLGGVQLGEAAIVGGREGIPRALTLAGGAAVAGAGIGAVAGAAGGPAAPVTVPTLAIAGAAIGFVGSMSASILSNMNSQRTDTANAQQRVLDEGKQNMQDWATQAGADPANRAFYLKQFNNQKQEIQNAHVQFLTDVNSDVTKFETGLTQAAEFNTFYGPGGELEFLESDMRTGLLGGFSDEELQFRMFAMASRRGDGSNNPASIPAQGFFGGLIP